MRLLKGIFRILILISVVCVFSISPMAASAEFIPENRLPAWLVLGQPDFTQNGSATTQSGMNAPNAIAVDPVSHKVFVADWQNNRVLRFASSFSLSNGAAAEVVLGQADFTSGNENRGGAVTANTMARPFGVFVDDSGRLWVADEFNHRILRFDDAANKPSGADANGVLGQQDFTHNASGTTQNTMNLPLCVFVTDQGQLWVVDSNNNRILRFDDAVNKTKGAPADGILGQPNFTTNIPGTSQTNMSQPTSIYVDPSGKLWVVDMNNHRVLRFDEASMKTNGAPADGVLGQTDFISHTLACTQSGMGSPAGISGDLAGNLFVSIYDQSRVLIFENAAGLTNGADAAYVLGQLDFTTCSSNIGTIGAETLNLPSYLFYDKEADNLWIADRGNNRVLMYTGTRCYVKFDASGAKLGTNWLNAYTDLQSALTSSTCKEIWVAEGTYKPTSDADRDAVFVIESGVRLFGGFAGTETELRQRNWAFHPTILSGNIGQPGMNSDNVYHVVTGRYLNLMTLLDGFIIQDGYADDPSRPGQWGGGLYLFGESKLTLRNVIFQNNYAFGGGGLFINHSEATLINVVFVKNTAKINGAALHTYDGGIVGLYNVTISGNQSGGNGGGITLYSAGDEILMGNTILWGNTAPSAPNLYRYGNVAVTFRASYSLMGEECPNWANCDNILPGNTDPKFVDLASGNLRLLPDSPVIDAGSIGWVIADTHDIDGDGIISEHIPYDLDAEPRIVHSIVDLGAYEFGAELFLPAILR